MKKNQERALNAFAAMDTLPESMVLEAENALITAEGGRLAPKRMKSAGLLPSEKKRSGRLGDPTRSGWCAAVLSGIVAIAVLILVLRAGKEPTVYPPPKQPAGSSITMSDHGADFTLSMELEDYPDGTNRFTVILTGKTKGKAISMHGGWHLERLTPEGAEAVEIFYTEEALISAKPGRDEYATLSKSIFGTGTGGGFPTGTYRLHATEYDGEKYVSVAYCTFTIGDPDETVTPPTDETNPPVVEYPPAEDRAYTVTTPETLEMGSTWLPITVKAAERGEILRPHRKYNIVKLAGNAPDEGRDWLQSLEAVEVHPDEQNGGYAVYADGLTLLNPEKWLPGLYRLYALNFDGEYVDYCDFVIKGDHGRSFELFVQDTVTTADPLISVQFISHRMGQPFGRGEKWDLYRIEDGRRIRMGGIAIESALEGLPVAPDEFAVDNDGVRISEVTNGQYQTLPAGDYELVFSPDSHSVTLPFTVVEDPDKQLISGTFLWVDGDPMLWDGGEYLPIHLLPATEDVSFDGLTTGYYVEVIVGDILETAPPTTQVHRIVSRNGYWSNPDLTAYVEWLSGMGYTVTEYPVATQILTGYFLPGGSTDLLITDGKEVTCLLPADGYEIGGISLTAGDRVEVTVDTILESWPGQTHLYALRKLSDGDVSDIPADILAKLEEAGWYQGDK